MRNTITKIGARSNAIDAYRPLLVDLAAFDAGANVKGRRYSGGVAYMVADPANVGQLPQHYREQFAADATLIDYVVWSYETPIAWHVADVDGGPSTGYDGFWEIPWVRYSQTTSQHQARITGAIRHANAAGGRMDRRPAGPFVNLMTGRGHRGITPGWQSGGTPEERGVATLAEPEPERPASEYYQAREALAKATAKLDEMYLAAVGVGYEWYDYAARGEADDFATETAEIIAQRLRVVELEEALYQRGRVEWDEPESDPGDWERWALGNRAREEDEPVSTRPVPVSSGEGAIYSPEYLHRHESAWGTRYHQALMGRDRN